MDAKPVLGEGCGEKQWNFGLSKRLDILLDCYDTYAKEHAGGEDRRDDRFNADRKKKAHSITIRKARMLRIEEYTNGVAQWYLLICNGS